jgi:transposase
MAFSHIAAAAVTTPTPTPATSGSGSVAGWGQRRSHLERLEALLDSAFLEAAGWDADAQVLRPPPDHPHLGYRTCRVVNCGTTTNRVSGLCQLCHVRWEQSGQDLEAFVTVEVTKAAIYQPEQRCSVPGCIRPIHLSGDRLCNAHRVQRVRVIRLPLAAFLTHPRVRPLPAFGPCRVVACPRLAHSRRGLCRPHDNRWKKTWRRAHPGDRPGDDRNNQLRAHVNSLARLSESLRLHQQDHGDDPAVLGRADIVAFLGRLAHQATIGDLSPRGRSLVARHVAKLLRDCRDLGLAGPAGPMTGLPEVFAMRRGDVPDMPDPDRPGKAIPPVVLRQVCAALPTLEARSGREMRVGVQLLTGLGCWVEAGWSWTGPAGQDVAMPTIARRPAAQQERERRQARRLRAAELFAIGVCQAEIARQLGVSPQAVSVWHARFRAGGTDALHSRGPSGPAPKVADAQFDQVEQALLEGATANGFVGELWTLDRVATVIERLTGVRYHPAQVWALLRHRLGWSVQRPARRAPPCQPLVRRLPCWNR